MKLWTQHDVEVQTEPNESSWRVDNSNVLEEWLGNNKDYKPALQEPGL